MNHDQAIRERLHQIIKRHSQAKIAKETGFSRANVSQYAKATRIPASFASALVEKLGVNPAWLLSGQGMPFELDVIPESARGDSVEALVFSLKAISKLKFGELIGKRELEDLRKLKDALEEYQEHHDKIHELFEPLFDRYDDAIEVAFHEKDFDLVASLIEVAMEIARLCRNRDFERRMMHYQGRIAYYEGDFESSLEVQNQLFLEELAYGGEDAFGRIGPIINYVLALNGAYHKHESMRVGRAALALFADFAHAPEFQFLRLILAYIDFSLGNASSAMGELTDAYARVGEHYQARNLHTLRIPMLVCGVCGFDEIFAVAQGFAFPTTHSKAIFSAMVLAYVPVLEDAALLAKAIELLGPAIEAEGRPFPIPSLIEARALLDAYEQGNAKAWQEYLGHPDLKPLVESKVLGDRISQRIVAERIARASGNMRAAKKLLLKIRELRKGIAQETQLNDLGRIAYARAMHFHFGKATQRRGKAAPTKGEVDRALLEIKGLRDAGWALLDKMSWFAEI